MPKVGATDVSCRSTIDENGKVVMLAERSAGSYFGEAALLPGSSGERTAYARSNDVVKLIKVPKSYFRLVLNRDSTLASAIQKIADANKEEVDNIKDRKFNLYGKVSSTREFEKVVSLDIFETKIIKKEALYFKSKNESVNISEGDILKIEGSIYEGKILIDKYEKIQ